ncbi:MAG: hypothetical protein ABIS36_18795 [Chryseolinea sp.]
MRNPDDVSQWQAQDVISRGYIHDPVFVTLLQNTRAASAIGVSEFDAIMISGGQGPMFKMEKATDTINKFSEFYAAGKPSIALGHGVSILRYATHADGQLIAKGKAVTGFSNIKEDFADEAVWSMNAIPRGNHIMPWRIEDELKKAAANFIQGGL